MDLLFKFASVLFSSDFMLVQDTTRPNTVSTFGTEIGEHTGVGLSAKLAVK